MILLSLSTSSLSCDTDRADHQPTHTAHNCLFLCLLTAPGTNTRLRHSLQPETRKLHPSWGALSGLSCSYQNGFQLWAVQVGQVRKKTKHPTQELGQWLCFSSSPCLCELPCTLPCPILLSHQVLFASSCSLCSLEPFKFPMLLQAMPLLCLTGQILKIQICLIDFRSSWILLSSRALTACIHSWKAIMFHLPSTNFVSRYNWSANGVMSTFYNNIKYQSN